MTEMELWNKISEVRQLWTAKLVDEETKCAFSKLDKSVLAEVIYLAGGGTGILKESGFHFYESFEQCVLTPHME